MSEHVREEEFKSVATSDSTRLHVYRASASILEEMGIIRRGIDTSKYIFAAEEIARFMSEHGIKYIARLVTPLLSYNVFVIDHVYAQGAEDDYAKIIAMLKKWGSDYRVVSFPHLVLENEGLLEKLGVPISHFIHLLSGAEGKARLIKGSEERVEVSGGVQVPVAGTSTRIEKLEKQIVEKEVSTSLQTIRTALTFVFENVKKPTVLVVDSKELELIGASTILKATMANKNLVVLVYDTGGDEELKKLLESGRATRFVSGFPSPVVKSELINMCLAMSRELSPRLLDIGGRKGTRTGVSATIKLLSEVDVLNKVAGFFVKRFENPYVAFNAMATFVAKMYARFIRSPESILEAYSNYSQRMKKAFSNALMDEAFKVAGIVAKEVMQKFYKRTSPS